MRSWGKNNFGMASPPVASLPDLLAELCSAAVQCLRCSLAASWWVLEGLGAVFTRGLANHHRFRVLYPVGLLPRALSPYRHQACSVSLVVRDFRLGWVPSSVHSKFFPGGVCKPAALTAAC